MDKINHRVLATLSLICLLIGTATAQTVFTRAYRAPVNARNVEFFNHNLLVAGGTNAKLDHSFAFMKLDTLGQLLNGVRYKYRGKSRFEFVRVHPQGGYVLGGYSLHKNSAPDSSELVITRVNAAGVPAWARAFRTSANKGGIMTGLDIMANGNIVFAGHFYTPSSSTTPYRRTGTIVQLDSAGNKNWERHVTLTPANPNADISPVRSNVHIASDGVIYTGWNYQQTANSRGFGIRAFDDMGNVVWDEHYVAESLLSMTLTPADNGISFYFRDTTNQTSIAHVDSLGEVAWAFRDAFQSMATDRQASIKANLLRSPYLNHDRITAWGGSNTGIVQKYLKGNSNVMRMSDFTFRGTNMYIVSHSTANLNFDPTFVLTRSKVDTVANCFLTFGSSNNYAAIVLDTTSVPWGPVPATMLMDSAITFQMSMLPTGVKTICKGSGLVWPGDANSNGIANVTDLIFVGLAWGETGPARVNPTINWVGQFGLDWNKSFFTGANYKHADANGNGHVGVVDLLAILANYGKTHNKNGNGGDANDPPLYLEMPTDSIPTGEIVSIPVFLGTADKPLTGLYGVSFSVGYNPMLVDTNSMMFTPTASWLGTDSLDLLYMQKDFQIDGELEVALTRTDQSEVNGYGQIGVLTFVTIDDIAGKDIVAEKLKIEIIPLDAMSSVQEQIPLHGCPDSVVVVHDESVSTAIKDQLVHEGVGVFPNPATDRVYIHSGSLITEQVEILNN